MARKKGKRCRLCERSMIETHRKFGQVLKESMGVFFRWFHMAEGRPDEAFGEYDPKRGHALGCAFRQAKWWGLIVNVRNGVWRMTTKGKNFLEGRIHIQESTVVYNGTLLEIYGPMIHIDDVLSRGNPWKMAEWRGAVNAC